MEATSDLAHDPRRTGARSARLLASWERCSQRGLSPDSLDVPFTDVLDPESRLARAAAPVLHSLQATLAGEPVSAMVSDSDGVVVDRQCTDRAILAALDTVALAPGSTYSESAAGTNGFGLALVEDQACLVSGHEHFVEALSTFTCAGAPVHDLTTGGLVGAVSLTTWSERHHDLLLALALQTAMTIEALLTGQPGTPTTRRDAAPGSRFASRCSALPEPNLTRWEEMERAVVLEALKSCHGRVDEAARQIGVSRATVYRRLRRYRLDPRDVVADATGS